jgi:hypothetical protein
MASPEEKALLVREMVAWGSWAAWGAGWAAPQAASAARMRSSAVMLCRRFVTCASLPEEPVLDKAVSLGLV